MSLLKFKSQGVRTLRYRRLNHWNGCIAHVFAIFGAHYLWTMQQFMKVHQAMMAIELEIGGAAAAVIHECAVASPREATRRMGLLLCLADYLPPYRDYWKSRLAGSPALVRADPGPGRLTSSA